MSKKNETNIFLILIASIVGGYIWELGAEGVIIAFIIFSSLLPDKYK